MSSKTKNKKSTTATTRESRQQHEPRVQKQTIEVTTKTTGDIKGKRVKRPTVTVLMDTDDLVKDQVGGFVDFLRDNSVIALAIGFVAGSQAQALVKTLIASFIDPAFQLFFGKSLSTRTFFLEFGSNSAVFGWGAFAYALLNIVFVLATIYILIKAFKLDRLVKSKDVKEVKADKSNKKKAKKTQVNSHSR